jgi:hypothetical protein
MVTTHQKLGPDGIRNVIMAMIPRLHMKFSKPMNVRRDLSYVNRHKKPDASKVKVRYRPYNEKW